MKNNKQIAYGIIITVVIFSISMISSKSKLETDFIPSSFTIHTVMMLLSFATIFFMKDKLSYKFSIPRFKTIIKPAIIGLVTAVVAGVGITILMILLGGEIESHPSINKMNTAQIFVFAFIYASISEEILFRGFLLNFLKPLTNKRIVLRKLKISLPVIISAIAFGLGHLILISSGVGFTFLIRVIFFTTALGLVAGYYQEKYDNNAYAIIVHMAGNTLAVVSAFAM